MFHFHLQCLANNCRSLSCHVLQTVRLPLRKVAKSGSLQRQTAFCMFVCSCFSSGFRVFSLGGARFCGICEAPTVGSLGQLRAGRLRGTKVRGPELLPFGRLLPCMDCLEGPLSCSFFLCLWGLKSDRSLRPRRRVGCGFSVGGCLHWRARDS